MKDLLRHFLPHNSYESISDAQRTHRRWGSSLAAAFTVIVLFGAFSAYLFFEIDKGALFSVEDDGEMPSRTASLDREELDAVLLLYGTRAEDFEKYQQSQPEIP